jgi:hypothetical protein
MSKKEELLVSFFGNLFKSKDYPKNISGDFESSKRILKIIIKNGLDSSMYEHKSILWGAIQCQKRKII